MVFAGCLMAQAQNPVPHIKPSFDPETTETLPQATPATMPAAPSPVTLDDLFKSPTPFPTIDSLPADALPTNNALPYAPTGPDIPDGTNQGRLYLSARLLPDGPEIDRGITWRIYSETIGPTGRLALIATATGGVAEFDLDPGTYLVHTSYGHAGSTKRLVVTRSTHDETIVLNAGGLKLNAVVAKTIPLTGANLRFDIYEMDFDERGERRLVARNIRAGAVARLNVGTYHVVSRYGAVNAVVRADIRVEPGKLTEATIYHDAARVTLKLVNESGGEALANTAWSVLTPGGDAVVDGTGAFPSYVLAAGSYIVIARHMEKIFTHEFEVNGGLDREVEVKAVATN